MQEELLEQTQDLSIQNNLTKEKTLEQQELEEEQKGFLKTTFGQVVNSGMDLAIRAIMPDLIEDEIINIKDSLITDGFKAAVDTAIEETTNLGKSLTGMITGTFENISQIKNVVKSGGLIDQVSDIVDSAIDWAKEKGWIKSSTAKTIKKGKNTIMKNIEKGIENTLDDQVEALEKIDGYIEKWQKYYNEQNFTNMEYQYKKIQEYLEEVIPLEETIKKARQLENLHELIKNKGKDFNLTEEEKELANLLT